MVAQIGQDAHVRRGPGAKLECSAYQTRELRDEAKRVARIPASEYRSHEKSSWMQHRPIGLTCPETAGAELAFSPSFAVAALRIKKEGMKRKAPNRLVTIDMSMLLKLH
jgi:hypothetical protein